MVTRGQRGITVLRMGASYRDPPQRRSDRFQSGRRPDALVVHIGTVLRAAGTASQE
jgi:hypothetical protein